MINALEKLTKAEQWLLFLQQAWVKYWARVGDQDDKL